ncbi:16S rRNA (guanine(966)-N(2))-methyltransferase [Candidatus Syntrophocurvum alkaliphilum]|uniref:16S rRNA (Guanine(966)-N(2))-methyltransferase n=1 Tax=Candidatus Syntrophocurvum alkaliphilum TaxID=2293317 RepID=A0A6I6D9C2_9FIRM|nr:16S rRNA (guanine(966)-N(2))-methyltransferase [Candidatus Syntrophocurvum alkaliphilum]
MRVIAGNAKGRKLKSPPCFNTRPITDRIKEALFNTLSNSVKDAFFLDLFAGSGSVGIEALSRGASKVVFIDNDINSIKIINKNLINCNFVDGFEVYRQDVLKAIKILCKRNLLFDIIYIDPPFTNEKIFSQVMNEISKYNLLNKNGQIIIRIPKSLVLSSEFYNLKLYREKNYGESTLKYYELSES